MTYSKYSSLGERASHPKVTALTSCRDEGGGKGDDEEVEQ
jgi:hypothetical protein